MLKLLRICVILIEVIKPFQKIQIKKQNVLRLLMGLNPIDWPYDGPESHRDHF